MHSSIIIYLIGRPGVGKFTIATALVKYNFIVCDNQLINQPIFQLLNNDGLQPIPQFAWDHIRKLRTIIFDFLKIEKTRNYILTNSLYDTAKEDKIGEDKSDNKIYKQVEQLALIRKSLFIPVKLSISIEQHLQRITQESRLARWKTINPAESLDQTPLININHVNLLEIDVSDLTAEQVAIRIITHITNISNDYKCTI